jgi:hypothetical protein
MGETEGGRNMLSCRTSLLGIVPVQTPGDHEVQYEPKLTVKPEGDPLSDAPQMPNTPALDVTERRTGRAQEEWVPHLDPFKRPVYEPPLQRLNINGDIGQFRHRATLLLTRKHYKRKPCGREHARAPPRIKL